MKLRSNIKKAKERQAKYHDRKATNIRFEIGDPVYLKNVRYEVSKKRNGTHSIASLKKRPQLLML